MAEEKEGEHFTAQSVSIFHTTTESQVTCWQNRLNFFHEYTLMAFFREMEPD